MIILLCARVLVLRKQIIIIFGICITSITALYFKVSCTICLQNVFVQEEDDYLDDEEYYEDEYDEEKDLGDIQVQYLDI